MRQAVVYEPPLFAVVPGGDEIMAALRAAVDPAMAAVLFPIEMPWVGCFVPDRAGMRATGVPLTIVTGVDNRDTWFHSAAAWLAEGTGADRAEVPGGHVAYVAHPEAFAGLVRDAL